MKTIVIISVAMIHVKVFFFILLWGKSFIGVYSVTNIIPESITACEEMPDQIALTNTGEGEGKSWTGDVNIPFQIDHSTEFTMDFRWYKNDELEKNGKILKGKACFYIKKFADHVWKQIKEAAKPPIGDDCTVQPGKYQFTEFVPDLGDFFLPIGGKGKANAKINITKDGDSFCAIVIADIK